MIAHTIWTWQATAACGYAGTTTSSDFPATAGEPTGDYSLAQDVFLIKIAPGAPVIPEIFVQISGPDIVERNDEFYYQVRVRNIGAAEAQDVQVIGRTDSVKDIGFIDVSLPGVELMGEPASEFAWSIGTLSAGGDILLQVQARSGDQARTESGDGPVEIAVEATTSSLPGQTNAAMVETYIEGILADLAIDALPLQTIDGQHRRRFRVSELSGTDEPLGAMNVTVEFTATLTPAQGQQIVLKTTGGVHSQSARRAHGTTDRWHAAINLSTEVDLPNTVWLDAPASFTLTSITASLEASAVEDSDPANNSVALP